MKKVVLFVGCFSLLISVISCKKDSETDATLSYTFGASNMSASLSSTATVSGVVVTPGTNSSVNWNNFTLNISNAVFSASHAGATTTLESKNINIVNALRPDSLAGKVTIASGVYENIKLKITMAESPSSPPFILTGTYTEASGTKIPVIFQINQSQLATLEQSRFEVATSGQYTAKVVFEMNSLLKGLTTTDFGQTVRTGANNTILVNATTNRALFEKLLVRLATSVSVSFIKK